MAYSAYGTSFDDLEDEERDAVSKKPTPIQDQVATDERGRRRFHGAFTGGFSAGYFNTVGTKQGWVPQDFRSSRDERADKNSQRAEDFMDAEDLGEFGIASRRIRQSKDFAPATTGAGPLLAWERGGDGGGGGASSATSNQLASDLEVIIKPVSDSIGVRMLRSMGWRQGRAVGMATIREAAASRQLSDVDREQLTRVAPHWFASGEDERVVEMQPLSGRHGIGYEGSLAGKKDSLSEKYGQKASVLKGKSGRGIRGQAFGVGAFEDEDESVYTSFDLNQYDFSIGPGPAEKPAAAPDSTFVAATSRLAPRRFFPPPRLPDNFKPEHKLKTLDKSVLPLELQAAAQEMSALQRSKFFGENRQQLRPTGGERSRKSRWDVKAEEEQEENRGRTRENEQQDRAAERAKRIEFPDEPMKQARFREFLSYLRRGLSMPQPREMTVWEWDNERNEFEGRLLPDERAFLPDVIARTKPLAKSALALPLMDLMRNKFIGETNTPSTKSSRDEDRLTAVRSGMFGELTRQRWEWYPAFGLAKLFNVPHPFPGSTIVGLPHLQNKRKKKEESLINLGLPNTAAELAMRSSSYQVEEKRKDEGRGEIRHSRREQTSREERDKKKKDEEEEEESQDEEDDERPPPEFFAAIFGRIGDAESEEEGEAEKEKKRKEKEKEEETERRRREQQEKMRGPAMPAEEAASQERPPEEEKKKEKVITVMDMDAEYGPAAPPGHSETGLTGFSVIRFNDVIKKKMEKRKRKSGEEEEERGKKSKRSKREKKSKKEKKHKHKKEKKSKKSKKKSRRHSPSTSSSSSSSTDSDVVALD